MNTEYGFALIKQFLSFLFKLGVIFQVLLEVRLTGIRSTSSSENVRETQSPPVLKILHRPVGFAGCCPAFGKGLFQMFLKKRNPLLLWCTWPDMPDLWGEMLSVHSQGLSLSPKVQVLIKDGWVEETHQPCFFNLNSSPTRHHGTHYIEIFMLVKPHP